MNKGLTTSAYIAMRQDQSARSEMSSQLVFGETFDILEKGNPPWIRIRNEFDGYEGWISAATSCLLDPASTEVLATCQPVVLDRRSALLKSQEGEEMLIPGGSILHRDPDDPLRIYCKVWYSLNGKFLDGLTGVRYEDLQYLAGEFINTPYLWGGRSTFGFDCSGLVQVIFRILGTSFPRDTSDQHKAGRTVNLLSEALPGDLAYFDDDEGMIIHVGILLDRKRVLHASGHVRIDPVDHQGIYNESAGTYSHRLRLIKRI